MCRFGIVALRNEKGSYNKRNKPLYIYNIVALRNEKGSYNLTNRGASPAILELRNRKDTPLIDNIILKIERILHAVRRAF